MPASTPRAQQETWKNATPGTVFLRKLDHRGELTQHEQVNSGRSIHLTPEERRINMEMCADEAQDPFRNGTLEPVRLIDTEEDARELANNPNSMAEADMRALFGVHHKTFDVRVASINNVVTLERLLALAHDEDATIKKVERIQARIQEVNGLNTAPRREPGPRDRDAVFGRPVSPR